MAAKGISLILPTRDRPKLAYRLLKSIAETTAHLDQIEVILYLDEDDKDSQELDFPGIPLVKIIGNDKNMGAITNKCYDKSHGKFIMLINDDMLFRTPHWDEAIIKEFNRVSDGIALMYGNDLYYGKRVPTFPILSRTACAMMGYVCPAEYKRHCIESHLYDLFSRLSRLGHDRLIYLPDVVFEHMHYNLSTAAYDRDRKLTDNSEDQQIFTALATDRQKTAIKLAEHIESCIRGVRSKT